jgi:hypothetical protein
MGSFFYTPEAPLSEHLLTKTNENHVFMRGDILLIQTDDLLELLGFEIQGFHFQILCTTLYYINAMHLVSILVYRDNIYNSIT